MMRKIIAPIFVFVIAASVVGSLRLAFALNSDKSIRGIKPIAMMEGSCECVTDIIRTKGGGEFILAGIGGTTLDTEPPPPATPPKPPETPQPVAPEPAPSETSKEHGVSPPAAPLTPQHEPRSFGAMPPPVITPGEVSGHGRVKAQTGSQKPVISKEKPKKLKEKGKTTARQAKTAKGTKPQPQKTVRKAPATRTVEKSKPEKRPTPMGVTKSLESK